MTLDKERARASVDPRELESLLRGGDDAVALRKQLLARLVADPDLGGQDGRIDDAFLSRHERYVLSLKRAKLVRTRGYADHPAYHSMRLNREGGALEKAGALGLHVGMFLPTIELLGTKEQREEWLPRARTLEIIGTYAQTELGHGTNLAKLETTAEYDASTGEFVIHTPSVSATKWWPGGLGKHATHCVLMAKMILAGVDMGLRSFIVPLRSLETHLPLPGIELGDIGPKMGGGYDRVDNGYLICNRVRVPRSHMLARHGGVDAVGNLVPSVEGADPKSIYGTMLIIRVFLVEETALALQHATTIATRYSAVRVQGGQPERQILDYRTQQARLLPLVASAYACHFAAMDLRGRYWRYRQTGRGLATLHATSACLKSHCTSLGAGGIETCRLLCGGHGYSMASGLPALHAEFVPSQTYEGDNVVLLLQTARWIVKRVHSGRADDVEEAGPEVGGYLGRAEPLPRPRDVEAFASSPEQIARALAEASRLLAHRAVTTLADATGRGGLPLERAWSEVAGTELLEAARAHARLLLCESLSRGIGAWSSSGASTRTTTVLGDLRDLLQLTTLLQHAAVPLLESRWLPHGALDAVRRRVAGALTALRPEVVALCDAFGLSDWELSSVLGRSDGNVYANLLAWARRSPFNKSQVVNGFEEHVRPIMGKCNFGSLTEMEAPSPRKSKL